MKYFFITLASLFILVTSCSNDDNTRPVHTEKNSVYYWKTVLNLDSANIDFIRSHIIGRVYLRMFDVSVNDDDIRESRTVPNASIKVNTEEYTLLRESLSDLEFVPVVYITLDALKRMKGDEGFLASKIVTRVNNMCKYNGLPNVKELQLDCDWTTLTEQSFFSLCDSVKQKIADLDLPWRLSSTIRLHQLARQVPPVDNGVLMVYNTGSFDNPDAKNSILDVNDVAPYLDRLTSYPLHLDVAYPTYSWQLLFHNRKFVGLTDGLQLNDTTCFSRRSENLFVARKDIPHRNRLIRAGDMVRYEASSVETILAVKNLIEDKLSGRPHSNIIYHLDLANLSNYTPDEIDNIYSTGR